MRSTRSNRSALAALLVPFAFASCGLPSLSVTPRYAKMEIDGEFASDMGNTVTQSATFDSMGLDDAEGMAGARLDLEWGSPHLILSTGSAEYSGSGNISGELEFEGQTISANAPVDSQLDIELHQGLLIFDVIPTDLVDLSLGFGATLADFYVEINESGGPNSIEVDEAIPIPVLAANLGGQIWIFEVNALVSAMSLELDDFGGSYTDIDVNARVKLFGGKNHIRGSFVLGYRSVTIDAEYEDGDDKVEFEAEFTGPYVGFDFTL